MFWVALILIVIALMLFALGCVGVWLFIRYQREARRLKLLDDGCKLIESDVDRAVELLKEFIPDQEHRARENDPLLHRAYVGLARCHIRLRQFKKAAEATVSARDAGTIGAEDLAAICDDYRLHVDDDALPLGAIDAFTRYLLLPDDERSAKAAKELRKLLHASLTVADDASEDDVAPAIGRAKSILALGLKEAWLYSRLGHLHYRADEIPDAIKYLKKALALPPKQTDDLLVLGKAYRKSGDHRAARQTLLDAYRSDTEHDTNIAFEAGRACLRWPDEPLTEQESLGKPNQTPVEAARELLEGVVKDSPDYAPGWLELGQALLRLGLLPEATAAIEKALALDASLAGAQSALGQSWRLRGDKDKARAALADAQKLSPNVIETVRLAGDLAYDDGRFADALASYRRLGSSSQDDLVLVQRLAHCYLEADSPARVIELLKDRPLDRPALRLLFGRALARQQKWGEALETLQGHPTDAMPPDYRYYYAAALAANGKRGDAEPIFSGLAALPDWQHRANRQLGHLKVLAGDFKTARQHYGMNHQPDSGFDLARLALVERDIKSARQFFEDAAKGADPSPATRAGLAMTRALSGQDDAFSKLLDDPQLAPWAHEQIGVKAYRAHRFVEALNSLQKAAEGRSQLSSTLICQLANSYLAVNRYKEALQHLVELARRFPRLIAVRHDLALCRFQLGLDHFRRNQWDMARQEWNRAVRLLNAILPEQAARIHQLELEASYRLVMEILQAMRTSELELAQNLSEIGCKEVPTDARWWFAAGLAAALRNDHLRAAECFAEARKLDKGRTSFSLGCSLSFLAMDRQEQARLTLEKTLEIAKADTDPKHAVFPVATRFALATAYTKKRRWVDAAKVLEPLLEDPLIKSSRGIQPADVAQAMVAYYGLAGDKEHAAELARKHLDGQGGLGSLLIGLVQAEGGDYSGAAESLENAYQQDPNPKIVSVLVSCLLAEAARLILEGDLRAAGPLVRHGLKLDPNHADAKKLEAALSFGSRLKGLDQKQLDNTIRECETLVAESTESSAQLTRTLGVLFHRKALQAEKQNQSPDEAWSACLKYWRKKILNNDAFWKDFEEEYNEGKGKKEKIKPDELAKWRKELPADLARDHALHTTHYFRKWDKKGIKRHLPLIWDWARDWTPPADFLLKELENVDESKLDFLTDIRDQVKNDDLSKLLGKMVAGFWVNRCIAKKNLAIDQGNRGIELFNQIINNLNAMSSVNVYTLYAATGQLQGAVNMIDSAKGDTREALRLGQKAAGMSPDPTDINALCGRIREDQEWLDRNYNAVNGELIKIRAMASR